MAALSLEALDLNLLVTLDVLLTELNVSRAAKRLSLSQPAVSRALSRLRDGLGDELFVRTGHGMQPTARALELAGPLRRLLSELEGLVCRPSQFVPAEAKRRFRVAGVDYALLTLFAPFANRLEREAPGIDLSIQPLRADSERDLETGAVDLLIEPQRPASAGVIWTRVHDETYTCVIAKDHALARLTTKTFAELDHCFVSPWGQPGGVVDDALARHGLSRRVAVCVPSFLLLPHVLAHTRRIATVPLRMAKHLCRSHPLRMLQPPIEIPGFSICMGWHEVHRNDEGHAWLRSQIERAASERSTAEKTLPSRRSTEGTTSKGVR